MLLNPVERNIWGELEPEDEEEVTEEEASGPRDTEVALDEAQVEAFQIEQQLKQAKSSTQVRALETRETLSSKRK